jgi:hypothetical protein
MRAAKPDRPPEYSKRHHSSDGASRRRFTADRRVLSCRRRCREPAVGLVGRRGTAGTDARWISSINRPSASWRFRSWVRWRWAVITRTPSRVSRLPASRSSRARTAAGNDGEWRTSKRSRTAVATLLTFCPPGPDDRTKSSSNSPKPIEISSVIRIRVFGRSGFSSGIVSWTQEAMTILSDPQAGVGAVASIFCKSDVASITLR